MGKKDFNNRCTVLMMGRNASLNLCYISSLFIEKYWRDCPYEKVLCTQTKKPEINKFDRIVYTNEEMIFGDRLKVALDNVSTEYVILMLEDFFLKKNVSNEQIERYMDLCEREGGGAIKLNSPTPYTKKYSDELLILPEKAICRLSLQVTLFKTNYLKNFTRYHFSPWQFEREGSIISRKFREKTFCSIKPVYDCVHAWSRGMWHKEAYNLLEKNNIDPSLYADKKIYPLYMRCRDKICWGIIRLAPHTVTRIRIIMCRKNEKKLHS